MKILDADTVAARLPYASLVPALRSALARATTAPTRVHFDLGNQASVLAMPAWNDRYLGMKCVNVFPRNTDVGKPTISSCYLLSDRASGEMLALIDGETLTTRRTAAIAALAGSFLAPPEADHILLVGSGQVARELPAAFASVRPIRRVSVWSRNRSSAVALAARLCTQGFEAAACDDLAAAVATVPIIACATFASDPLIAGAWLGRHTHVSLIGGFRPTMREADTDAVARSYVVADTRAGVLAEAGDLLTPIAEGRIDASHVQAELAELCRGDLVVPASLDVPTMFKSVGHAAQDLAAAALCMDDGTRPGLRRPPNRSGIADSGNAA